MTLRDDIISGKIKVEPVFDAAAVRALMNDVSAPCSVTSVADRSSQEFERWPQWPPFRATAGVAWSSSRAYRSAFPNVVANDRVDLISAQRRGARPAR